MASIINASTSGAGGLITTADNTGNLNLQSNGTTVLGVTSGGVAVTGTLTQGGNNVLTSASLGSSAQAYSANLTEYAATGVNMRNRIINGDMRIDQRNAGAAQSPITSGNFVVDRFKAEFSQSGKLNAQQNAGSVTPPTGFTNYAGLTSTSAYTVGASDYFLFEQFIEGYNTADLAWGTANAKTVTLSFWVRSSLTGTFGGVFSNASGDRIYGFSYTISSANTWEQKTITVTGDTTGTWNTTNSSGIQIRWGLGIGSSYSISAGSWGSSGLGVTGAVSVVGTNGATFYITGVQLEVGSTATPFERRMYGQELALCQRYYFKTPTGTAYSHLPCCGYMDTTTNSIYTVAYPVFMRTAPSFNTSGNFSIICAGAFSVSSFSYQGATTETMRIDAASSGLTVGRACLIRNNNDTNAYFEFSAEL